MRYVRPALWRLLVGGFDGKRYGVRPACGNPACVNPEHLVLLKRGAKAGGAAPAP